MPELALPAQVLTWLALMSLVMAWLARSRLRPPPEPGAQTVLRMPTSVLILSLVCLGMFTALAGLSFGSPTGGPVVAAGFLAFAALGAALAYVSIVQRYELLPDGFAYHTIIGARRTLRWGNVRLVRYSPALQWFVITLDAERAARLSATLPG